MIKFSLKSFSFLLQRKSLRLEYSFYRPLYELVSSDLAWFELNRRLLRIQLMAFENHYEIDQLAAEATRRIEETDQAYLLMLIAFFERRMVILRQYFDQYYYTIAHIKHAPGEFYYGYIDHISKILLPLKAELHTGAISLRHLRYLHNYVFFFYSEMVLGIQRYQVVRTRLTLG